MTAKRFVPWLILLAGVLLIGIATGAPGGWTLPRWSDVRVYSARHIDLPAPATAASQVSPTPTPGAPASVVLAGGGTEVDDLDPQVANQGWAVLAVTPQGGGALRELRLVVVPAAYGALAGTGALACAFALPFLAIKGKNPWYQLLSEGAAGLSLARVQLLLWFTPAVFIFAALSFPLLRLAPIDGTLSALLGLGGLTAAMSSAASGPAPGGVPITKAGGGTVPIPALTMPPGQDVSTPTVASSLSDLVTGWDEQLDFTRYQYLAVSLLGAIALFVAFFGSMTMPAVPKEFLYLIGASQIGYVGTKAVKASKT